MTKQTKQWWEEEFDERFIVRGKYENGGGWEDFHEDVESFEVRDFIRKVEDQTRQQTLEEVFDLLEAGLKEADGGFFGRRITLKNMIVVLKTIKKSLLNQLKEK